MVDWSTLSWPAGSLSNSYDVDPDSAGNDVDWHLELGYRAFKIACPFGPADGLAGLHKNVEFVAKTRAQIGDDCELMLDCWMAFDLDYTVRLAETLRPYRLKWIEECLIPEDVDGLQRTAPEHHIEDCLSRVGVRRLLSRP